MPEPGVCPVCGDTLEYTGVGKGIPTKGKVCFAANCLCGYHTIERYEFQGLNSCSLPTKES